MFKDTEGRETQYGETCLELQTKLEAKEQECEELKQQVYNKTLEFEGVYKVLRKKEKALDELERYCNKYPTNSIGFKQSILDIINKTKENK